MRPLGSGLTGMGPDGSPKYPSSKTNNLVLSLPNVTLPWPKAVSEMATKTNVRSRACIRVLSFPV